jgi:hypothetical protein
VDFVVWINTFVILFVVILAAGLGYASLREIRAISKNVSETSATLAEASQTLSRLERITLATLEHIAPTQGQT